jgi:hypothetical protein
MGIRILFGVFLGIFASFANAVDAALPWSFVNGSAKGYSIQLISAFPAPGSKVAVGQTVEFKIIVSYQLSIADKGSIVLVIQDENNKNLLTAKPQHNHADGEFSGSDREQRGSSVRPLGTPRHRAHRCRTRVAISGEQ